MKNRLFIAALCVLLGSVAALKSSAQIYASDDAGPYSSWATGINAGFGFVPWTNTVSGGGYQGFYIGNSPGASYASPNGNYWGMYANGAADATAVAYRGFSNSLPVNTVFKIKWKTEGIGFSTSQMGGFCLRNGNACGSTADYNTNFRLMFYYIGGSQDSFLIWDGSGVTATGIGFGSNPLQIEVTLLTADTYRLVIKDATGVNTLGIFDNMTLNGSGTIDSASLFAINTGGDQKFNDLSIQSTSLVPPEIVNLSPSNGTVFASSASPFSFDAVSSFSTISSNGIQLTLNGIVTSNLTVTGSGTWSNHVELNTALQDNQTYTGTIVATDANGNHATNQFSFNTWRSDNPYFEAEDYNFSGGVWVDNFLAPQPNQAYQGLIGSNGIDYLEYDLTGTNNAYRPGDLPQTEAATDVDHDSYAANGFQDYNLGYIQNGEWENYTRRMAGTTYAVYARMAGFGGNPTMLIERLATPTAVSSNQPRASLGTFVCPNTGGAQNWTFVQLKDFFSNPVYVNFPGTNTFRLTDIGDSGSYNVNYLTLVPVTNTATLLPYLSSGYPYPNVGNVAPDALISFTIANRQTVLDTSSVQLFLNSSNVTSGITLTNNSAGTVVLYQSPTLLPAGTNTLQVIFSDTNSVSQTNNWQFTVASLPTIPTAYALPLSSANASGFAVQIAKADDTATNADFPTTIARALAQLAGTLTNSLTGLPYTNTAAGPNNDGSYIETNAINYDITGTPQGFYTFNYKTNFPYVPANGTNNYIALSANTYLYLTAGVYTFAVRSDDGFMVATGPTLGSTNMTLGIFDAGRGNNTPTTFDFIVQTNGLYPIRLIYDQGEFGGNVEFYSINRANGTPTLINDPATVTSIKAYRIVSVAGPVLNIGNAGGNVVLSWSDATYSLQAAPAVTGTYTNVVGATSPYTTSTSGTQRYFRLIK